MQDIFHIFKKGSLRFSLICSVTASCFPCCLTTPNPLIKAFAYFLAPPLPPPPPPPPLPLNMTAARFVVLFVAASLLAASCEVSGQAPAPGPSADCFNSVLNMSDCLTYVETGSNVTVPDEKCCPELAGMVENNPVCLCELIGKSDSFGVDIDVNRALKLPSECDVVTPPTSLCAAAGVPISSPGTAATGTSSSNKGSRGSTPYGALSTLVLVSCLEVVVLSMFS